MDFEHEIDLLDSTLSDIEDAIDRIKDIPYYNYVTEGLEETRKELEDRLNELSKIQNNQWEQENKDRVNEYWGNVI